MSQTTLISLFVTGKISEPQLRKLLTKVKNK